MAGIGEEGDEGEGDKGRTVLRIGVLTGGGDCAGLNAAIRAVVRGAQEHGHEVLGIPEGWAGVMRGETVPLSWEGVEEILAQGGTVLGTSRTNPMKSPEGPVEALKNIEKMRLDALIPIGGDDTLGVAARLSEMGLPCVGIPKTMDNDVWGTDYTIGFHSAASVATDAVCRLKTTARSHRRVIALEVMGREAGWVALHSGIAGGAHYTLIPEVPVSVDEVCDYLEERKRRGRQFTVLVVAEGVTLSGVSETSPDYMRDYMVEMSEEVSPRDCSTPQRHSGIGTRYRPERGRTRTDERSLVPTTARNVTVDEFGHVKLGGVSEVLSREVKERTGLDVKTNILGYIQRGGSPTPFDRILASRMGLKAVDLVTRGRYGVMVALQGDTIREVPITEVLGRQRLVDRDLYESLKLLIKVL
ncbi:MAG TPA: 6-phosphofructokinase [Clostridia bacterium]|nr:6-phosphofructokinase [Clostridia bacterium]